MTVEQHAESWLNAHSAGAHFAWLHFYDPHDPYEPPEPYSTIYKDRLYDGEIAYADSALGKFLDYLKRLGWYDEALIVVVGDHGEGLGEHHEDTHGIFLYDSTTHVPLIVKLPKNSSAGKQIDAQVRTIDILPTILDLLGFPAPEKLDGASLTPLFSNTDTAARIVFGQTDFPLRFGWAPLRSVRKNGFKFIEAPNPELYDLRSDAQELHNEYEPWNVDVQKLRKTLAELHAPSSPRDSSTSAAAVPAGTIDELHALGYLGPADARSSTDVPEPSLLPDPKDKIEEQNLLHATMMATENDEPAKARAALEKLLQSDGASVIGLTMLGRVEMESGNHAQALRYWGKAHALHPEDAALTVDYARAQEAAGDISGASATLQSALKVNPNQFPARLLLGKIYFRSGNTSAAVDEFEEAALLEPENVEARTNLAQALIRQKKFAEVVDLLEPAANSTDNDADLFATLAKAYRALGHIQKAQRAEARAKELRVKKN
jgi:tetratricopeptide (TPR) repeat protein